MTQAIPEGFHTITPTLVCENCDAAIAFYTKALGATQDYRMDLPNSKKVMHACLTVGSSKLYMCDPFSGCEPTNGSRFNLYVEDCDKAMKQAISAGCEQTMAAEDMFWGDRMGAVKDKYGNFWSIATRVKDISDAEMVKGRDEFIAKLEQGKPKAAA